MPETKAFFSLIQEQGDLEVEKLKGLALTSSATMDETFRETCITSGKIEVATYFLEGMFEDDFVVDTEEDEDGDA